MTRPLTILAALLGTIAATGHISSAQRGDSGPQTSLAEHVRMAVRAAPSKSVKANADVLDAFERYFEPIRVTASEAGDLQTLSKTFCGHSNSEWIRRARERSGLTGDLIRAGTQLLLPPCPFYSLGGTITVSSEDTVSSAALREIGQSGNQTLRKIADLNSTTPDALNDVVPGEALRVPYTTVPVSLVLKSEFAKQPAMVAESLVSLSTVIRAATDLQLTLVPDLDSRCDARDHPPGYPLSSDDIVAALEFNERVRPFGGRKATIGVIDTGVDRAETRLFFDRAPDGSIGANMDKAHPGFPTTPSTYANRAHGTHVAGLVLGGLQGTKLDELVRERLQVRIINIVSRHVSAAAPPTESFTIPASNLTAALAYARRELIPILSMSVETTTPDDGFGDAFAPGDYLVVVAAGNSSRDIDLELTYPASLRKDLPRRFLTVAATTPAGLLAPFSNHGSASVDIAAPGCDVSSLLPEGRRGPMSGTSQAAPLVAFAAGLLYAEGLNLQEVRNRIRTSAKSPTEALSGNVGSRGVLDLPLALSIYEDVLTVKGQAQPLKGRIDRAQCLTVDGQCRPLGRIARITRSGRTGETAWTWLRASDGEAIGRATAMPSGGLRFKPRGANNFIELKLADIDDMLFAVRQLP